MAISSEENRISISGEFSGEDPVRLLAAMHSIVNKRGYKDFTLDFLQCTKAFSSQMLSICTRCQQYWKESIDISLRLPTDDKMRRLFLNANWAHYIDFRNFDESRFRGYTHAPVLRFTTGQEQANVVSKTLDILLAAISHFRRDEIRYIEWAVNEITDNVINHAKSNVGGFIQTTNFRQRKQIEFAVCDGGLGIPGTLRPSHPELQSDAEALDAAIKEGVTRDKSFGQGNGLYGSWRISQLSGGDFKISSGYASLSSSERDGLRIQSEQIPLNGSLVICRIGYGDRYDLSDALLISGRSHVPVDYIETHYNEDNQGNIEFKLKDEAHGFGSRSAGEPVRRKLVNLIGYLVEDGKIVVDLEDVHLVSSSFADEVFGKLFLHLGPIDFTKKIALVNIDPLVKGLIDRSIVQRISE